MKSSNVARRYAQAFFAVAGEEKRYEEYYHELHGFTALMAENLNLKNFFINPIFGKADKKAVLNRILEQLALSRPTANFIRLLIDKQRISAIDDIEENYRKLMDSALGIARVQVKTAFSLQPEMSASLKRALESLTGDKLEMQVEEDPSLLGGIVVRVGDKLYDGSIRMQLDNMKKLLVS